MARIYSVTLWSIEALFAGTYTSAVVPDGDVWVVRDIVATSFGELPFAALEGFVLSDNVGIPIFSKLPGDTRGGCQYHWQGRQVLNQENYLQAVVSDGGWQFRVMGYQLTP